MLGGGVHSSIVGVSGAITRLLRARRPRGRCGQLEPVREAHAAQLERREHRRRRDAARAAEPRVERARELRVAHAESRVRDPAAAREQVERELDRLEVRVARDRPKYAALSLAASCVRSTSGRALELVVDERGVDVPARAARGAAASAIESSIASFVPEPIEKCAVCAASPSRTTLPSCHVSFVTFGKSSQSERFEKQLAPAQLVREQLLAEREALLLVHLVEAGARARPSPGTRR